jgi:hypothetical protein
MTFRFLAPAQAGLFDAITYYAEINAELGARFEQAVANSVRAAAPRTRRSEIKEYTSLVGEGFPLWCHRPRRRTRNTRCRIGASKKTARVLGATQLRLWQLNSGSKP